MGLENETREARVLQVSVGCQALGVEQDGGVALRLLVRLLGPHPVRGLKRGGADPTSQNLGPLTELILAVGIKGVELQPTEASRKWKLN